MTPCRVVVTGWGAVSPLGLSADALWDGLAHGRSGIDFIRCFDASDFPIKVSGEVRNLPEGPEPLPRTLAMAYSAASEAAGQAGLAALSKSARCGVFCGSTADWPNVEELVDAYRNIQKTQRPATGPSALLASRRMRLGAMPALIARRLGIADRTRAANVVDDACASGGMIIGEAFQLLRRGALDVAVAVGASSWTNLVGITLYHKLSALSTEPTVDACRPFDAKRSGFVMAEGAGALVLETLDHARARGAVPLAEVTGYGCTVSAYRITDMPDDGIPQLRAMEFALRDARRTAADVDYINAHGTATLQNDVVETRAIHQLLGARAPEVPISSNKSMVGHTITAAGTLEAIASIYTIRNGIVPPTINLHNRDEDCDLDYVPNVSRARPTNVVISNSFGFGGQNCALVLEAYAA